MRFTPFPRERLKVLNEGDFGLPVLPSDSIYYDWYPYRVEFTGQTFDNRRSLRDFRREIEDFVDDFNIVSYRSYISKKAQRVYFNKKQDLETFVGMYHSILGNIRGPINDDHADLLCDLNIHIELKDKLYYGKYDAKISCVNKDRYNGIFHLSGLGNYSDRINKLAEDIENLVHFISENLEHIKVTSFRPYVTNFFCDYNELQDLMPFIHLHNQDILLRITKCILEDK